MLVSLPDNCLVRSATEKGAQARLQQFFRPPEARQHARAGSETSGRPSAGSRQGPEQSRSGSRPGKEGAHPQGQKAKRTAAAGKDAPPSKDQTGSESASNRASSEEPKMPGPQPQRGPASGFAVPGAAVSRSPFPASETLPGSRDDPVWGEEELSEDFPSGGFKPLSADAMAEPPIELLGSPEGGPTPVTTPYPSSPDAASSQQDPAASIRGSPGEQRRPSPSIPEPGMASGAHLGSPPHQDLFGTTVAAANALGPDTVASEAGDVPEATSIPSADGAPAAGGLPAVFRTSIVARRHVPGSGACAAGVAARVCPDAANPRDRNALHVVGAEGYPLGFLPAHVAAHLAPLLKQGAVTAVVAILEDPESATAPVPVEITVRLEVALI